MYASTGSHLYTRQIFAILMENGICTDGIHKVPPEILNNKGINGSFQNLISDNRVSRNNLSEFVEWKCDN